MLPAFNEHGYLPGGVHPATLDEIEQRFGRLSELRRAQMDSLRWMVDLARRVRPEQIVLNGSFVTDILDPNDVDIVWRVDENFASEDEAVAMLGGLPFLQIQLLPSRAFEQLAFSFFSKDRLGVSKGVVELIEWI